MWSFFFKHLKLPEIFVSRLINRQLIPSLSDYGFISYVKVLLEEPLYCVVNGKQGYATLSLTYQVCTIHKLSSPSWTSFLIDLLLDRNKLLLAFIKSQLNINVNQHGFYIHVPVHK